ncbi:hypothetical protein ACU063_06730 [Paenibacillus sp. M.A.Huq-81]
MQVMDRKVERLVLGDWKECQFKFLSQGDVFRLFEPDGDYVSDSYGNCEFQAESMPYVNENGHWEIEIEESQVQL